MATQTPIARKLRKQATPEEKKLWFLLQDRRLSGFKFRRQVWIDKYCTDFCCYKVKLIIEVDGGNHNKPLNKLNDSERTEYLESQGFRVLRFWNSDIANKQNIVLEKIRETLFTPHLSRLR
jgi:adenine-specific DNA-methyltransferase